MCPHECLPHPLSRVYAGIIIVAVKSHSSPSLLGMFVLLLSIIRTL